MPSQNFNSDMQTDGIEALEHGSIFDSGQPINV